MGERERSPRAAGGDTEQCEPTAGAEPGAQTGAQPIEGADGKRKRFKLELDNKDPNFKNSKERFYDFLYDKLHLTVKAMDVVLVILVVLFVVFMVIGYLKGNGGYAA